jgi:hypothetical protein
MYEATNTQPSEQRNYKYLGRALLVIPFSTDGTFFSTAFSRVWRDLVTDTRDFKSAKLIPIKADISKSILQNWIALQRKINWPAVFRWWKGGEIKTSISRVLPSFRWRDIFGTSGGSDRSLHEYLRSGPSGHISPRQICPSRRLQFHQKPGQIWTTRN